jgi:acetyl esterase/lipase
MSDLTSAVVVSDYRQVLPEFKFPTAHNDSYAACNEWVLKNMATLKGDAKMWALVGESVGQLKAVSMMARIKVQCRIPGTAIPLQDYHYHHNILYYFNAMAKPL